ncbi:DUF86 domain-containing protein [Pedobacter sp. MC2016-15]|uniref:HepT-like ribonuclease domain-containing protein n=1 Tax=Pedobacter sp. MC2016-15 TaxID=2994473 RepID=UPI00224570F4|nr:HepT-like ribonuclease domain-containing protein [Pedobacter sp. MC2016-15]MCX2480562.1 DUF86 domain-containing protein [Pedobacter sp. MC2016-15]
MDDKINVWLYDILNSILEIESFFLEEIIEFELYERDLKTKRAVERNIEIIGEAMTRILRVEPDIALTNTRQIVDTRNRIIHGYDTVSDEIIWSIVFQHLPLLKSEIENLLGE